MLRLIGVIAIVGLLIGFADGATACPSPWLFCWSLRHSYSLGVGFWPYMIPYSVTVRQAAGPVQSLGFLFWGAGIVVFPVELIYTSIVYWIFRGNVGKVARHYW